ncbi:PLC-like phosphodiesterase [Jimgerdemannia flammicorona]|uniref:glycerophosphodiester phosphodiesterase n=1 Tax=Jimgerdemannia flammicorona TaxID=994334 RepID=A0A433Q9I4_9FUNG|nr:PLC-like phosphodiesterase [Jimgerdemannia flammicorona]
MRGQFFATFGLIGGTIVGAIAAPQSELKFKHNNTLWKTLDGKAPKIVGHRGEKAIMPEHTLGSWHLGIIEHADFVEPDVVLTKDFIPVCYHDLSIGVNTDVADHPEFAHLKRNLTFYDVGDGIVHITNDWLVSDFSLAELKTLRVKHVNVGPKSIRLPYFDQVFSIPTLVEFLELVANVTEKVGYPTGIIPELKHPKYHQDMAPDRPHFFEDLFLATLANNGYPLHGPWPRSIWIQNFDKKSAQYLASKTSIPLVQLQYANADALTYHGLDEIAKYAKAVGPWKQFLVSQTLDVLKYEGVVYNFDNRTLNSNDVTKIASNPELVKEYGGFIPPREYVREAHKRGLQVAGYTYYTSNQPSYRGCETPKGCFTTEDRRDELFYFFELGMDQLFCENNAEAVTLRQEYQDRLTGKHTLSVVDYKVTFGKRAVAEVEARAERVRELYGAGLGGRRFDH